MAPKKDTSTATTDDGLQLVLGRLDANAAHMTTHFTALNTTLNSALTSLAEAISSLPTAISLAVSSTPPPNNPPPNNPPPNNPPPNNPPPNNPLPNNPPPNNPPPNNSAMRPPKIHLPTFDGSNPLDWLFQATNYFDYYSIQPAQRLSLAQFYFTSDALSWYKYLANNRLLGTWAEFSRALELRFGPSYY
ncbi:hypothetical protein HanRHA438_Chr06g0277611 [Helianthus annuus]|nr:hypothetical protein HanRHA438_Chr06g0277611 [Helianthus annuus]